MSTRNRISVAGVLAAIIFCGTGDCNGDSYSTAAIADAFVATGTSTNDLSDDNFGAAGALTVEAGDLAPGEFQTVIKFDLSAAQGHFDSEYGASGWTVQSVSLQLSASSHGNPIFNPAAAGEFGVSLMQNNSWVEGTGTGGNPTTNGISYDSLEEEYINNATDEALGMFSFDGESVGTNAYALGLTAGLAGDAQRGSEVSLRLYPADGVVSYLFSSRTAPPGVPELIITAVAAPSPVELIVTRLDGSLAISWTTHQTSELMLQQNSDLSTTNWTAVPTNSFVVTNGQYEVIIAPSNAQEFFRLAGQ